MLLKSGDPRQYNLYFVRHAEATLNREHRICGGQSDCPLTNEGKEQADELGREMHRLGIKPGAIVYSPMLRTYETGTIINRHLNVPMLPSDHFREQKLGLLEGKAYAEVSPADFEARLDPPEGETYADFYQRVHDGLHDIVTRVQLPMIISHGGVWHALKALVGDLKTHWLDNASAHMVDITSGVDGTFASRQIYSPSPHQ